MGTLFDHLQNRSIAHIKRFNAMPQHFEESVAEHSFFVAYTARLLCDLLSEKGENIDIEKAVTMALVHDIEESISGDILGPFKHRTDELRNTIAKVNREMIKEVFDGIPPRLAERYIALWTEEGEGETTEAQVVKTADKLSLIIKCAEEIRSGNMYFMPIYETQYQKLEEYQAPWWKLIKEEVLPPYTPFHSR